MFANIQVSKRMEQATTSHGADTASNPMTRSVKSGDRVIDEGFHGHVSNDPTCEYCLKAAFPFGMDCIPQSAKSPCRIGTSDEREAVQLEAIYARTAWIVELEASRRDGAVDPFPRRATGRHPRRHDGSVLFGPRLGRGPHNQRGDQYLTDCPRLVWRTRHLHGPAYRRLGEDREGGSRQRRTHVLAALAYRPLFSFRQSGRQHTGLGLRGPVLLGRPKPPRLRSERVDPAVA